MTEIRTCKKCGIEKEIDKFSKYKSRGKVYRHHSCDECRKEYTDNYRRNNKDKIKKRKYEYQQENRVRIAEQKSDYNFRNRHRISEYKKKYNEENREKIRERQKVYCRENRAKNIERSLKWNRDNPERVRKRLSEWQRANPDKVNAIINRYRARKLSATPNWLTSGHHDQIESFYNHARDCYLVTGEKYHVDHIVPLQGDYICGLHVPWNLQVLPSDVNISKGNKFFVDMLESHA